MGSAAIGSGNQFAVRSQNLPSSQQHRMIMGKGSIEEGQVGNGQPVFISTPTGKGGDFETRFGLGVGATLGLQNLMSNPFAGGKYPSEMTPQELEDFQVSWAAAHPEHPQLQSLITFVDGTQLTDQELHQALEQSKSNWAAAHPYGLQFLMSNPFAGGKYPSQMTPQEMEQFKAASHFGLQDLMGNPFAGGKYPSQMTPQEEEESYAKWTAAHPELFRVQNLMANPFAGGKYPSQMTPQELEQFQINWATKLQAQKPVAILLI